MGLSQKDRLKNPQNNNTSRDQNKIKKRTIIKETIM